MNVIESQDPGTAQYLFLWILKSALHMHRSTVNNAHRLIIKISVTSGA